MRVSLVLLTALGLDVFLRRRSAAARHWILAAAMLVAAATPLLEQTLPSWSLPVNALRLAWANASEVDIDVAPQGPPLRVAARSAPIAVRPLYPARLGSWLTGIWMVGLALSLLTLVTGLLRLRWLTTHAEGLTDGPWVEQTRELTSALGIAQTVRVLQSRHPGLLVTWGHRHPRIILPDAARTWTPERARAVLAHELAHIKRSDWAVQIGAALLRAAYWFNPLAWLAASRLRQHSEQACDDVVLATGIDSAVYAEHLLAIARTLKTQRRFVPELPAPAIARPSSLERRIDAMLNVNLERTPLTRTTKGTVCLVALALALPVASLVSAAQSETARWSGTMLDQIGRVLPESPLALVNEATKARFDVKSDPTGHFELIGIPAGEYLLQTNIPGFDYKQGRVFLEAGQNLQRDVALQVGSIEETLWVTSELESSTSAAPAPRAARAATRDQPPADACAQSAIGGCIKPPFRLTDAKPVYPQSARTTGAGGTVVLEGRIGTDGLIKDLRVQSPVDGALASAAFEAVRQWQFTATHLDGVPIEVPITVTIRFAAAQ